MVVQLFMIKFLLTAMILTSVLNPALLKEGSHFFVDSVNCQA